MPEPALMIWILCFPLLLAVYDLIRTRGALRHEPPDQRARGVWSDAVLADATQRPRVPPANAPAR